MAKFVSDLFITLRKDSDTIYVLGAPLLYKSDALGLIEIPTEFQTDFASVPRIPIIYAAWGDKAHREAVLHDYLYRTDSEPVVSFMQANGEFLDAMKSRSKPWRVRYPMYWGVCAGGYFSYHKHKVFDVL